MKYGICPLSIVPLRAESSDKSELVSQVLYGEVFKVLERQKKWSKIRLQLDGYEGWVDNKQYFEVSEEDFEKLKALLPVFSADLVDFVHTPTSQLLTIPMGCNVQAAPFLSHRFEGHTINQTLSKSHLVETAVLFLNSPYLWGGKTPFGIDCSGFTQMVYKLNGFSLLRDASQQATQGDALSFIEESEPGDLAFFDNAEGAIIHVGIIMQDNYIIHSHGKVRIDRLDHNGIFNADEKKYSHKLRVIKKIL
ncbi:MAG: C40 family peptidase [Flavobacteriaceae bacterium]